MEPGYGNWKWALEMEFGNGNRTWKLVWKLDMEVGHGSWNWKFGSWNLQSIFDFRVDTLGTPNLVPHPGGRFT